MRPTAATAGEAGAAHPSGESEQVQQFESQCSDSAIETRQQSGTAGADCPGRENESGLRVEAPPSGSTSAAQVSGDPGLLVSKQLKLKQRIKLKPGAIRTVSIGENFLPYQSIQNYMPNKRVTMT